VGYRRAWKFKFHLLGSLPLPQQLIATAVTEIKAKQHPGR